MAGQVVVGYSDFGAPILGDPSQQKKTQSTNYNVPQGVGGATQASGIPAGSSYTFDPRTGQSTYSGTAVADAPSSMLDQQARIQAAADARHLAMIQGLWGSGGSSPALGREPQVNQGAGTNPSEDAARAAIFARAKDQTGALASSQLRGLQEAMAERGIAGSGIEALNTAGVIGGARGGLDQLTADQMAAELNRAAAVSDRNYAGNLEQRGQDITQRGQDYANQQAALNNLLSLFSIRY